MNPKRQALMHILEDKMTESGFYIGRDGEELIHYVWLDIVVDGHEHTEILWDNGEALISSFLEPETEYPTIYIHIREADGE